MNNKKLSLLFIALVGVQVTSAFLFAMLSDGFYVLSEGIPFRCGELLSSGGDDEVIMLIFVALALSIIFRMVRVEKGISIFEAITFFFILGAALWISIQSIDCGEFDTTLSKKLDPYLLAFAASSLLSSLTMIYLAIRR